jgi:hypothetical protein
MVELLSKEGVAPATVSLSPDARTNSRDAHSQMARPIQRVQKTCAALRSRAAKKSEMATGCLSVRRARAPRTTRCVCTQPAARDTREVIAHEQEGFVVDSAAGHSSSMGVPVRGSEAATLLNWG